MKKIVKEKCISCKSMKYGGRRSRLRHGEIWRKEFEKGGGTGVKRKERGWGFRGEERRWRKGVGRDN